MNAKGMKFLAVLAVLVMAFAAITVLTPELADAADNDLKEEYVRGYGMTKTYSVDQKVIVDGDWTVGTEDKAAQIIIQGELEVPQGSRLTVSENSVLVIAGGATVTISGTVYIDETKDTLYDEHGVEQKVTSDYYQGITILEGNVDISGTVTVSGGMYVNDANGEVTVKTGGELTVGTTGKLRITHGELIVEKDATATVKGVVSAQRIQNSGTVVINTNSAIGDDVKIYQATNGAVVDIERVVIADATKKIEITDMDLVLFSYNDRTTTPATKVEYKVGDNTHGNFPVNTITVSATITGANTQAIISKLLVTEKVSSVNGGETGEAGYVDYNEKTYTNEMAFEGDLTVRADKIDVSTEGDVGTVTSGLTVLALRGATIEAGKEVNVNPSVTFTNSINNDGDASNLTIAGKLNANHGTSTSAGSIVNNGIVIMKGVGIMEAQKRIPILDVAEIRGAMIAYTDYVQYMKIDLAIEKANADSSISDIRVVGNDDVSKTATVRKNVIITADSPFTIGATDNEVVLTLAADSALRGSKNVTVDGTLYAENKGNVANKHIISDVYSEQVDARGKPVRDGWAKWTNLQTALNEAMPGTKVSVNTTSFIILKANTEIKSGVTLYVPNSCPGLVLLDGITLTVNGTYDNESEIYAKTIFDTSARNIVNDGTSTIIVNGSLIDSSLKYAQAENETGYVISDDITAHNKLSVEGAPIAGAYYTNGDNKSVVTKLDSAIASIDDVKSDITVRGTVTCNDISFTSTDDCSKIIVDLSIAKANADDEKIVTLLTVTSLKLEESDLEIKGDATLPGAFTGKVTNGSSSITLKGISSNNDKARITEMEDELSFSGNFYIDEKNDSISVSEGTVIADGAVVADANQKSTMTIASGATMEAGKDSHFDTLRVNGTLEVPNTKTINTKTLNVFGDVKVAEPTSTKGAGTLTSETLNVGISSFDKYPTSASATITGPIATPITKAVILSGSSVDASAMQRIKELTNVSEFYVKDALWISVYVPGNVQDPIYENGVYNYVPKDLKDCQFKAWQDSDGKALSDPTYIGGKDKLYADIDYEIYTVKIVTDSGIKAVSIDGIQMLRAATTGTNTFVTLHPIEAGSHKVTYTLQDGYEGTAALYTEYGTILQNLSFTVSGTDDDDRDVTFQLYGTEKEVPAEPEEESEWTVTTILLLILVILIAVMAVIVAMRLNRS